MKEIRQFTEQNEIGSVSSFPYKFNGLAKNDEGELGAVFKNVADEGALPSGFEHLETLYVPQNHLQDLGQNFVGVDIAQSMLTLTAD